MVFMAKCASWDMYALGEDIKSDFSEDMSLGKNEKNVTEKDVFSSWIRDSIRW